MHDMGDPVSIDAVARPLIGQSARPLTEEYTGLRPKEKLHELLFGAGEPRDHRPRDGLLSHVTVPALTPDDIGVSAARGRPSLTAHVLAHLCVRPSRVVLRRIDRTSRVAVG